MKDKNISLDAFHAKDYSTEFTDHLAAENDTDSFLASDGADFGRIHTINKIQDLMNSTDWNDESKYHNTYRINGKNRIGRTIKMKNKDWHELNRR